MNTTDAAHRSRWRTADIVFGMSLLSGFVLNYLFPISLPNLEQALLRHFIGAPLLLLCGGIIYFSQKDLLSTGQPTAPGIPTTQIVKSGIYRYSRNPLYTGLVIGFCGLAIATNTPWLLILLIPTIIVTHYYLILPEERYLENKFGEDYRQYKARVRRWL